MGRLTLTAWGLHSFNLATPFLYHQGRPQPGTLCLLDQKQRYLTSDQKLILADMAAIVREEMELRLATRPAFVETNQLIAALEKENKALRAR